MDHNIRIFLSFIHNREVVDVSRSGGVILMKLLRYWVEMTMRDFTV